MCLLLVIAPLEAIGPRIKELQTVYINGPVGVAV